MNLWSLLGVSVAVAALFSIGVNELGRSQAFYETYRWFIIAGLGWLGILMFIVGRIKNARLTRQIKEMYAKGQTEINGGPPVKPFFFFSMAYWGVMFLVFGLIIFVATPEPQVVAASEDSAPPNPKKATPTIEEKPQDFPELKMQGVVFRQPDPSALINGRTYYVGDRIGPVKILDIQVNSVRVEFKGEERTLKLED